MQVVLSLDPGGTERLVIEIARALEPWVHSVVCCLDRPGSWAGELTARGIPVVALNRRPGFRPQLGRQIARLASSHAVDVLHCHHYSPFVYGLIGALIRRRLGVVFTEHGRLSDAPPSLKRRLANQILGRLPATICAVSEDLRRHMIAEGMPAQRVQVVHNGIDPGVEPTPAARSAARERLGLASGDLVIGTAGRLDPVKDLTTLVDAFAMLARFSPAPHLVIFGDGPDRSRLEQHAVNAGVRDRVLLAGYQGDVRALLPALDLFANSSTHEGVSLTILEAMAARLPVVATRVGGTPEVVVEDETGILVPSRAPAALAQGIDQLLADSRRRQAMGCAGRRRVEGHFSMTTMTASYLRAYRLALRN